MLLLKFLLLVIELDTDLKENRTLIYLVTKIEIAIVVIDYIKILKKLVKNSVFKLVTNLLCVL
jgi:hypothetical protein